jgi:endonuclease/exonuclease/phosphatase family metal-dependent hydrolase
MRLLSYNIHKGIGGRDRRYRLERIIGVIRQEKPDLICLQEVDTGVLRTRHDDQPRLLAQELEALEQLYQLNVRVGGGGGYGNLILSRWPLERSHQISLRLKRRKPRGAQLAVVETPEGLMHLVHWHLGLAERERRWQARHLLDDDVFRELAHLPPLVVGDFNDWLNTLARWAFARHGFTQLTAPRRRFRSFPAFLPMISLDKVFVRGAFENCHARVVRSRLAREASDHLPVVVDFHLSGQRQG